MSYLYNTEVYTVKGGPRPIVEDRELPEDAYNLDEDIQRILETMPERNGPNKESGYWLDEVCQSGTEMAINSMMGKGFEIIAEDQYATDAINEFNMDVNVNHDTIEDVFHDWYVDNTIHGFSLWIIAPWEGPEAHKNVAIMRMPPSTILIQRDTTHGWRRFVQTQQVSQTFKDYQAFISADPAALSLNTTKAVSIPDDPHLCIYCSLFKRAPMASVLRFVIYKHWIWWFLRKYAEKMWAPTRFAFVGDPKTTYYPQNDIEMGDALTTVNGIIIKMRNFSSATFPGNVRIEEHEPKNNGEVYLKYIDKLNESIMYGLYSSMATRSGDSVYKGSASPDEQLVKFLEGIRKKFERTIKRFYISNIVPGYDPKNIHFTWPELRVMNADQSATAFNIACQNGVFKDTRERRRAAAAFFPFLAETDITDEEGQKMEDEFITLRAPSQPGMSTVQAADGKDNSGKSPDPLKKSTGSKVPTNGSNAKNN